MLKLLPPGSMSPTGCSSQYHDTLLSNIFGAHPYVCGISLPHLNAKKWVDVGAGPHVCSEVDQFLFTCRSRCCFLFLFITWLEERLSMPALSKSLIIAHWRTRALTLHTAVLSGTSYGVALAPFSCALGLRSIPIYRAQGSVRQKIIFKNGYGTHFCHLPNIAFCCLYVHCSYPSMF